MVSIINETSIDIKNVCRVCLSSNNVTYLEKDTEECSYFTNIIENIISVPVQEIDITLLLCTSCLENLDNIKKFYEKCLQAYKIVKTVLDQKIRLTKSSTDNFGANTVPVEYNETQQETNDNEGDKGIIECPPQTKENEINDKTYTEMIYTENGIKCNVCYKNFENNEYLENHILIEHGVNDYKCSECKKLFADPTCLTEHIKIHKKQGISAKYACNKCEKCYTSSLNLKIHMFNHIGIKPFKCSFCPRGFTKKNILNAHLTIHTGVRDFICNECGKGFTSVLLLNRHKLIHTGDKPFKCNVCTGSFYTLRDLNIHMRSHTGEKPYPCSTCGKSFRRSTHLTIHRRIHTGEKPYSCATCGHSFGQSGDLRAHERTHTGEKPYTCTVCDKKFSQCSGLSTHRKKYCGQYSALRAEQDKS